PERCVVACCHSYYSFSTGFLGTDEICAASGRDRRAAYQPNEIASPQSIEMHPLPFARATRLRSGRDQVRGALQCGILTRLLTGLGQSRRTDLRDAPGMSAMTPRATQSVRRNEASRCATNGLMRCSKLCVYSITLSASCWSCNGIS